MAPWWCLAALLLLLASARAATVSWQTTTRDLAVLRVVNATECGAGGDAAALTYAPLGACLAQFNLTANASEASLRVSQDGPSVAYFNASQCGAAVAANATGHCAPVDGHLSANLSVVTLDASSTYDVVYYPNSSCAGSGISYAPAGGVLVSGALSQCTASISLTALAGAPVGVPDYSLVERINSSHVAIQVFTSGNETFFSNCSNVINSSRWVIPVEICVPAIGGAINSTTPFMRVSFGDSKPSVRMYVGHIDLNGEASMQNAQIVGASVGVLCGSTISLAILSFFGLID